jgi:hypothetical protein
MSQEIRLGCEPVRSLGFAAIGAGYVGIGTRLDHPARMIFIQNLTDALLMFSFNGIDDHFPLPTNGFLLLDVTSNKTISQGFFITEGQRLYVKQVEVPTDGTVYFTSFYGSFI